ncbi:NlpC/P60 family protein [Sphingomonas profundi]|uniref:NlpC/P60 family protein n=1 Tax=Alterirhizorhabdus profundi TaxID=2681549 RepID=UPI0012E97418|nr:NlpC/P60 family protein [Sphingomonas profundi]
MERGEAIARAAQACVGAPFRPQGRNPATGLDCVGLVAVACRDHLSGTAVPRAYAQRGGGRETIVAAIAAAGFAPIDAAGARTGDLLLLTTGPGQWHLAVLTADGFVHADARLRRVTEVPGAPPWPIAGAWRIDGED